MARLTFIFLLVASAHCVSQVATFNNGALTVNSSGAVSSSNTGVAWDDTVRFDKNYRFYTEDTVTSNFTVKVKSSGKVQGYTEMVVFVGDGSHTVDFSSCVKASGSFSFDATSGALNFVTFIYDGKRVWYSIMK